MGKKVGGLSIKQKIAILNKFKQKKKSKRELCSEYNCNISTINRIIQNEIKIRETVAQNKNINIKRLRKGKHSDVESALLKWFEQQRLKDAVISGPILLNKAKELAIKLGSDFEPTSGWLWRWQRRENIKYKKFAGESKDSDHANAEIYVKDILPDLIKDYSPEDIFNADESALFFKALPNGTLACSKDLLKGHKSQKTRITLLFLCNFTGSYKKIFTVGKTKNPRCFRNKNVPLPYFSNKNAWMTSSLWNTILAALDEEMGEKNRKIILFVDNAACHKVASTLRNINIQYLPSNTTSLIQPLDMGVIHSFKSQYRQIIIRKQLLAIETGMNLMQFIKSITVLDALYYVKRAWWLVTSKTIENCFRKAGFFHTEDEQGNIVVETENSFPLGDFISVTDFEDYLECDKDVDCYGVLTEAEIVDEVLCEKSYIDQTDGDSEAEFLEEASENISPPGLNDVIMALSVIKKFILHNNLEIQEVENLEERIFNSYTRNIIQRKITDYF